MSQAEAALYIHDPMFETTVAAQITANALWRNGLQGECIGSVESAAPIGFPIRIPSHPRMNADC